MTYSHDPAGRNLGTTTAVSGVTTASDTRLLDPDGLVRKTTTLAGGTTVETTIDWDPTAGVPQMTGWQTPGDTRNLFWGPGSWAGTIRGNVVRGVITDPHNSVVNSSSQQAAYSNSFDPWGIPANALTASGPKLGYRGELTIGGTVNLRHRDYQPGTGQFTSVDPLPDVAGTPTNGNPYHYTNNTPLNALDPMGLRGCVVRSCFDDSATALHGNSGLNGVNGSSALSGSSKVGGRLGVTRGKLTIVPDQVNPTNSPGGAERRAWDFYGCDYRGFNNCKRQPQQFKERFGRIPDLVVSDCGWTPFIDCERILVEAKSGDYSGRFNCWEFCEQRDEYADRAKNQALADIEIRSSAFDHVDRVDWHFYVGKTGVLTREGSGLIEFLLLYGINVYVHTCHPLAASYGTCVEREPREHP